jgi:hypothetical protein
MTQKNRTLTKHSALTISLALLLTANAQAVSIPASTSDYVKKDSGNLDSSESFQFKTMTTDSTSRYAYIRFDLSDKLKTELVNASSVTLDMYQIWTDKWNGDILQIYSLDDEANAKPGESTTETTWGTDLTWKTRPDGNLTLNNPNTTFLTTTGITSRDNNEKVVSLTLNKTALNTLIAADTNNQITLILGSNEDTGGNKYASVTNTGGYAIPTLKTKLPEPSAFAASTHKATIPEPSSFATLTGLIALGAIIARRRS